MNYKNNINTDNNITKKKIINNKALEFKSKGKYKDEELNTIFGSLAGLKLKNGKRNVLIGRGANVSSEDSNNEIVIGFNSIGHGNNKIVLGNNLIESIEPSKDNSVDLGAKNYKFKNIFINGNIYKDKNKIDLNKLVSKSSDNNFSGLNTFNVNLPTSTLTPKLESHFVTKKYVDEQLTNINVSNSKNDILNENNVCKEKNTLNDNQINKIIHVNKETQYSTDLSFKMPVYYILGKDDETIQLLRAEQSGSIISLNMSENDIVITLPEINNQNQVGITYLLVNTSGKNEVDKCTIIKTYNSTDENNNDKIILFKNNHARNKRTEGNILNFKNMNEGDCIRLTCISFRNDNIKEETWLAEGYVKTIGNAEILF